MPNWHVLQNQNTGKCSYGILLFRLAGGEASQMLRAVSSTLKLFVDAEDGEQNLVAYSAILYGNKIIV